MGIRFLSKGEGGCKLSYTRQLVKNIDLLQEQKDRILSNLYLSSCNPGVSFGFAYTGSKDVRLGSLLKLWEQPLEIEGERAYLLSCGALLSTNSSSWCLSESGKIDSGYLDFKKYTGKSCLEYISLHLEKTRASNLYVDLPRLLQELRDPDQYPYSQRLRDVYKAYRGGLKGLQPAFTAEQLDGIKLYCTGGDDFLLDVYIKDLYTPQKSLGLINHKAIKYRELIDELIRELALSTGYSFVKMIGKNESLLYRKSFKLYEDDEVSSPENLNAISRLFHQYKEGMDSIHLQLG